MARGKIQIKKIENSTNRQVTYSKRRNGLFKKAHDLTVLCDAEVSLIMVSCTDKVHDYISPSITTKRIFEQYQQTKGIDLWSCHYEIMKENLEKLKEMKIRREIRQRMGQCLNDLSFQDLQSLESDMESAWRVIHDRANRVLTNQIETSKKKVRNVEQINRKLKMELGAMDEDPYGLVDNGGDNNYVMGFRNEGPCIFAMRLQSNQPDLHKETGPTLTAYPLLE
uniref:MADS-box domain-containing protein n=1 Tax=Salix viminalis TaxID=40686 RepID=A0A6N2KMU2_SALVM